MDLVPFLAAAYSRLRTAQARHCRLVASGVAPHDPQRPAAILAFWWADWRLIGLVVASGITGLETIKMT